MWLGLHNPYSPSKMLVGRWVAFPALAFVREMEHGVVVGITDESRSAVYFSSVGDKIWVLVQEVQKDPFLPEGENVFTVPFNTYENEIRCHVMLREFSNEVDQVGN